MRHPSFLAATVFLLFFFPGRATWSPSSWAEPPGPRAAAEAADEKAGPGGPAKKAAKASRRAKKAAEDRPAEKAIDPADLPEAIRSLVRRHSQAGWELGVIVLDEDGKTLAAENADQPRAPASNQKVLVVGAALGLVGPQLAYETTLSAKEPPRGGAVQDLVVKGDGEPNISKRFHDGDPTAVFKGWAGELKKKGVQKVTGDLVVDDTCFDEVRFLPGWKENQQGSWFSAEVGALNLNDNCIDVSVSPTRPGQLAKVELLPRTAYVSIDNRCKTVDGARGKPIFNRKNGTNTVEVKGEISVRQKPLDSPDVTIEDPGLYFGTVLVEVLRAEGIAVEGKVVRGKLLDRAGPTPAVLVQHRSTLDDDLKVINKHSQNLHAEVLFKALGARKGGEGSVAGGARAVGAFLSSKGLPAAGLHMEDGSGLSSGNRVSPATLAGVLAWIEKQPFFAKYKESLPIAGVDGTLKRRFKGKKSSGRVFAKTGYLRGASALSGYVERGSRHRVFSVIVNGMKASQLTGARNLEEEIAEAVFLSMPEK